MIIIKNVGSCRIHPPEYGGDGLIRYDIEVLGLTNTNSGGLIGGVSGAGLQAVLAIALMHLTQFEHIPQEIYETLDGAFFDLMDRRGPDQEITIDVSAYPVLFSLHARDCVGRDVRVGPTINHFEITQKMGDLASELKQHQER